MRILFVSSTTGGGSGRSQRELARLLTARGHEVTFLVDDKRRAPVVRWTYEQWSDLAARWGDLPASRVIRWLEALPGRHVDRRVIDGLTHDISPIPENAFSKTLDLFEPDVVVGNSLIRLSWRKMREECARRAVPTVLYVREVATYGHLEALPDPAEVLVANASSLAEMAVASGHDCEIIPSVIDTAVTRVDSDRTVALLVNPIESHGISLIWEVARRLPAVPFVLQESWPLDAQQLERVRRLSSALDNVEFRRRIPPGPALYEHARVLLVPHQLDNRPRVIAEAQANGIPAIASSFAGLREAVGDGGIIVEPADVDGWVAAIDDIWKNKSRYELLSAAAREHGERAEIQPDLVVDKFVRVLQRSRRTLKSSDGSIGQR